MRAVGPIATITAIGMPTIGMPIARLAIAPLQSGCFSGGLRRGRDRRMDGRMGRNRETDALLRHAVPLTIRIIEAQKPPVRFSPGLSDDAVHNLCCQDHSGQNRARTPHKSVDSDPRSGDTTERRRDNPEIRHKSASETV
jgi:hypothetical protein